MSFDNLLVERESGVAVLTVQRPQRLNALDARTLDELRQAALDFQQDDSIRCVIVTGAGDKAFVAGADITELASDTPERRARQGAARAAGLRSDRAARQAGHRRGQRLCARRRLRARDGVHAAAVAADTARFGQPEINLGLIPGFAGTQRLAAARRARRRRWR